MKLAKRIIAYIALFIGAFAIATQFFTKIAFDGLMIPYLVILGYFTILFIIAQITKNNSIVDMHWGMGFVIGSWLTLWVTEDPTFLSYAIVALITVWGLRLSYALFKRNFGEQKISAIVSGVKNGKICRHHRFFPCLYGPRYD